MYENNYTPDNKTFKKIKKLQSKKEELLFLSFCSELDFKLINNKEKMSLKDFERITYLLDQLGFQNFCITFENQHSGLMQKLGKRIETEIRGGKIDIEAELLQRKIWENEFLCQLTDERMRTCFRKLFQEF